jgi:hypothetical protein
MTRRALLEGPELRCFYRNDTIAASDSDLKRRTYGVDNPRVSLMLAATLNHCFIANRNHVINPEFTAGHGASSTHFYERIAATRR